MRFRIDQGTVSIAGNVILDHCSFEIKGKEKIALVGENGAGKTTLLHLIAGMIDAEHDDKVFTQGIWMARNTTIGILEQNPLEEKDKSLEQYILGSYPNADLYSRERYEFEVEYHRMFTNFGFSMDDTKRPLHSFSGGEQTKIALIRLLLIKPDILLLDEPTNHLDLQTIQWLEGYLKNYEKAVVIVSHDRFFLDQVVNVVYELSQKKTRRYAGNYSEYRRLREKEIQIQRKKYKEQMEEIDRLNQLIERFKHKPKKASMARSKKKILERMERMESPDQHMSYLYPGEIIPEKPGSKNVFDCQKLWIGYDHPIRQFNLRIKKGQKIGIIGQNGIGKTTFLKTLAGILPPYSGNVLTGNHLEIAYFDQMTSEISGEERILQDFEKTFPAYSTGDCRKILSRFLFRKEDVSKQISSLSGGEKSRYTFAKLLERKPNVLLLDEPTNHLDIPSKEILESAFSKYQGTLLFITHDRYFLSQVAESLLIFEKDQVIYYPYDYGHYLASKEKEKALQLQGIHNMEEENAALTKSLEAVPKKTRMQSARFNTEQSYTDWQFELIQKRLHDCSLEYEAMIHRYPCEDMEMLSLYYEEYGYSLEEWNKLSSSYLDTLQKYTELCIEWYEKWLDYEDAFQNYHDA